MAIAQNFLSPVSAVGLARMLDCTLGLARHPVGIGLLPDKAAFDACPLPRVRHRISYCTMVMLASRKSRPLGRKAEGTNFACPGSAHVFGFLPTDESMASGRRFLEFGLYDRLETAAGTQADMARLDTPPHGVAVAPLAFWQTEPDTVLFILEPYQAMRLIQARSYRTGVQRSFSMVGNRGICSECTAVPLKDNRMNLSLLCSNTRFSARWKDSELGLGVPYSLLPDLVRDLIATLDACEPDGRKDAIRKRCGESGVDIAVTRRGSYFKR